MDGFMSATENPAPLAGGSRVRELTKVLTLSNSENIAVPKSGQPDLPAGLDPKAMPILARHWFGLSAGGRRTSDSLCS